MTDPAPYPDFLLSDSHARSLAEPNVILRAVVGSRIHGTTIEGSDDRDEMGVCVEPGEHFYGLRPRFEQWTARTKPDGERSGPGDIDLVIYSLAKWARLALGGNPTILTLLFIPPEFIIKISEEGRALQRIRAAFIGDNIFGPYLGYMRQQRHRLTEERKMPKRPELVERFGYDTKYAGHLIRLGYQGIELAGKRTMTLPMLEHDRKRILAIRNGEVSKDDVLVEASALEDTLVNMERGGRWGPPDFKSVEEFVIGCYRKKYG